MAELSPHLGSALGSVICMFMPSLGGGFSTSLSACMCVNLTDTCMAIQAPLLVLGGRYKMGVR